MIAIAVPIVAATLLFVAAIVILHRRRNKQGNQSTVHQKNN